jgi:hypothetical protein
MARIIPVSVANKIAAAPSDAVIVCDNSDYIAEFEFDAEWANFDVKTARFCFNGAHMDVIFTGNSVEIPRIYGALYIEIGVFAGDICTTTPARIRCARSILTANGNVAAPSNDVYSQIISKMDNAERDAASAKMVADKLAEIELEVEMLAPSAEATADVEQTENSTTFKLGIPRSNLSYATFEVDENMELLMHCPDGYDGVLFALNDNGELEVEIL